jgi:hypothetical protein
MKRREFAETTEERDRLNRLLELMGYVYEEGSRQRFNLRAFTASLVAAEKAVSSDGEYITFKVRSRIPVTQENLNNLESEVPLL